MNGRREAGKLRITSFLKLLSMKRKSGRGSGEKQNQEKVIFFADFQVEMSEVCSCF